MLCDQVRGTAIDPNNAAREIVRTEARSMQGQVLTKYGLISHDERDLDVISISRRAAALKCIDAFKLAVGLQFLPFLRPHSWLQQINIIEQLEQLPHPVRSQLTTTQYSNIQTKNSMTKLGGHVSHTGTANQQQ